MRTLHLLAVLAVACLVAGCGKKCTVTGKITRDGKPLEWENEENYLLVIFAPGDRTKNPDVYRAETDSKAGTYRIERLPAGTYLVSLQMMDPPPLYDALGFAYGLNNSPLQYEVSADSEINIDLPRQLPRSAKPPPPRQRKSDNAKEKEKDKEREKEKEKEKEKEDD